MSLISFIKKTIKKTSKLSLPRSKVEITYYYLNLERFYSGSFRFSHFTSQFNCNLVLPHISLSVSLLSTPKFHCCIFFIFLLFIFIFSLSTSIFYDDR